MGDIQMMIKLSEKTNLEGTFLQRGRKRHEIMRSIIITGEVNDIVDRLFIAKESNDFDAFRDILLDELFLELNDNWWYVKRLFNSDITKQQFLDEYNISKTDICVNSVGLCIRLGVI